MLDTKLIRNRAPEQSWWDFYERKRVGDFERFISKVIRIIDQNSKWDGWCPCRERSCKLVETLRNWFTEMLNGWFKIKFVIWEKCWNNPDSVWEGDWIEREIRLDFYEGKRIRHFKGPIE